MASKTHVKLLRDTIKMLLARGYGLDQSQQQWYYDLENPNLDDSYLYRKFGTGGSDSATKEDIKTSLIKAHIYENYVSETTQNLRMLMSDIFYREEPPLTPGGESVRTFCILFFGTNKFGEQDMKTEGAREMLETYNYITSKYPGYKFSVVFVTSKPLVPRAAGDLNSIQYSTGISHFTDEEIGFDPTAHVYNARSRVLKGDVLEKFKANGINYNHLPRIYTNEPVAKYLGANPGDIMEFQVESSVPGVLLSTEIFHRHVRKPLEKKKKR